MTEQQALKNYNEAYAANEANPSYYAASKVLASAVALVEISDDYTAQLDEADDIMGDYN